MTQAMTVIKKYWVYIFFIFSLAVFLVSKYGNIFKNGSSNGRVIKTVTFKDSAGWGYNILVNDTVYIHQNYIPGVPGIHPFTTEEDAQKVGNFVAGKLRKRKAFPTVYPKELDSLGIK